MDVYSNLFGNGSKISSNSIHTEFTITNLRSDSREWHDMPSGYYYIDSGLALGYPFNYAMLLHVARTTPSRLTFQMLIGSETDNIRHRRFNKTQGMDWSD